jgi:two-component system KDP operon response regulator KdpE
LRPERLIVEDDTAMRTVGQVVFGTRGWDVAVASSVADGLALLDPAPDSLILDLLLPDQGGEVILRRVRDDGLKTRVAVTTAADASMSLNEIRALKPDALFEKPLKIADAWREAG